MNNYSAESIKVLNDREHVRTNPGMYIGSTQGDGVKQMVYELVANSVDESTNGYGKVIEVKTLGPNHYSVKDYGRGIPVEMHPELQISALEVSLTMLKAGGKSKAHSDKGYSKSGGTYGVGASATIMLSAFSKAIVKRDGFIWVQEYIEGLPQGPVTKTEPTKETGTSIEFKADDKIFKEVLRDEELAELLEMTTYLNKGLKIIFNDQTFYSKDGLKDLVEKKSSSFSKQTSLFYKESKSEIDVEFAFVFTDKRSETFMSFANGLKTNNGGTHETQFKTTLTRVINSIAKEKGLLKDKETLSGENIRTGMIAAVSIIAENLDLAGQTKDKLVSTAPGTEVGKILTEFIKTNISDAQLKKIVNSAKANKKADDAAEKARIAVLDPKGKGKNKNVFSNASTLIECSSKKREECEIILVEGKSAGSGLATNRLADKQAILALKGKPLNVAKKDLLKILANEEFRSFIGALGCGILGNYKKNLLRYGKIIICADADDDGAHIVCLLITFIYTLIPELIQDGMVYVAVPPKFQGNLGNEVIFIKDQEELEELKRKHGKRLTGVHSLKGLGSMDASELFTSTLDPEKRDLIQLTIEDADALSSLIEDYMGTNVDVRKELIDSMRIDSEGNYYFV